MRLIAGGVALGAARDGLATKVWLGRVTLQAADARMSCVAVGTGDFGFVGHPFFIDFLDHGLMAAGTGSILGSPGIFDDGRSMDRMTAQTLVVSHFRVVRFVADQAAFMFTMCEVAILTVHG